MELPDVTLPDAQSEDFNATFPQSCCHRPRVSAVRVAISDQENDLGGVSTRVAQDLLMERKMLHINWRSNWLKFHIYESNLYTTFASCWLKFRETFNLVAP